MKQVCVLVHKKLFYKIIRIIKKSCLRGNLVSLMYNIDMNLAKFKTYVISRPAPIRKRMPLSNL